jgi:2,5-diamino-6-(ribosylamino)-4(3H)-pyrimidinone 5'-phosphate reductase
VSRRPYVLVNMAVTADGKVDTVERRGARISGPADTARVDRLRAESDAVMVGGRTLIAEDPRLTVRDPSLLQARRDAGRPGQPAKVGIVSHIGMPGETGSLSSDSRFLGEGGGRVLIHTTQRTSAAQVAWLEDRGAEVIVHGAERVDLEIALMGLADKGIERLMVEGGGTLIAALFEATLVDEVQLAIAPVLFGGETAPTPVGGPGLQPAGGVGLELAGVSRSVDDDVVLRYLVSTTRERR